ncbi:hypothetical protein JCM10207_001458 [Rhodosporidiobolus poonsookiae]
MPPPSAIAASSSAAAPLSSLSASSTLRKRTTPQLEAGVFPPSSSSSSSGASVSQPASPTATGTASADTASLFSLDYATSTLSLTGIRLVGARSPSLSSLRTEDEYPTIRFVGGREVGVGVVGMARKESGASDKTVRPARRVEGPRPPPPSFAPPTRLVSPFPRPHSAKAEAAASLDAPSALPRTISYRRPPALSSSFAPLPAPPPAVSVAVRPAPSFLALAPTRPLNVPNRPLPPAPAAQSTTQQQAKEEETEHAVTVAAALARSATALAAHLERAISRSQAPPIVATGAADPSRSSTPAAEPLPLPLPLKDAFAPVRKLTLPSFPARPARPTRSVPPEASRGWSATGGTPDERGAAAGLGPYALDEGDVRRVVPGHNDEKDEGHAPPLVPSFLSPPAEGSVPPLPPKDRLPSFSLSSIRSSSRSERHRARLTAWSARASSHPSAAARQGQWTLAKCALLAGAVCAWACGVAGCVCVGLTHARAWEGAGVVEVLEGGRLGWLLAASVCLLLLSLLGLSATLLHSRPLLAFYALLLWPSLALLLVPAYASYRRAALNLEGKLDEAWSRSLTPAVRWGVQSALGCCGWLSSFHDATYGALGGAGGGVCYPRAPLKGCKAPLLAFETALLRRIYRSVFAVVALHVVNIVVALLAANHVDEPFGTRLPPEEYRLRAPALAAPLPCLSRSLFPSSATSTSTSHAHAHKHALKQLYLPSLSLAPSLHLSHLSVRHTPSSSSSSPSVYSSASPSPSPSTSTAESGKSEAWHSLREMPRTPGLRGLGVGGFDGDGEGEEKEQREEGEEEEGRERGEGGIRFVR